VEYEDKLARLQAEKAKAEQKFFSTMKSKDQIHSENRALKQQLAKTAEVVNKVQEAERSLIQKMVCGPAGCSDCQGVSGTTTRFNRENPSCFGEEVS
jgi:BRE1 E3 ubiquitin ligase